MTLAPNLQITVHGDLRVDIKPDCGLYWDKLYGQCAFECRDILRPLQHE